ncbi:uncharacterized protein F4822DRAFT_443784 [Hypoxylon trugodes]|uniref:uncharacterized protein n=1 Tax=Hypoxylon trugodes TaxID=326681 RepID=UPI00219ACB67|nr:uncharacterized protein F4822DRAFT_443784 [Hypoxylon trugodes]KAI1389063.1 hypothetical protein F4822DRAFT_443784 [Hypoxylon trugodes]
MEISRNMLTENLNGFVAWVLQTVGSVFLFIFQKSGEQICVKFAAKLIDPVKLPSFMDRIIDQINEASSSKMDSPQQKQLVRRASNCDSEASDHTLPQLERNAPSSEQPNSRGGCSQKCEPKQVILHDNSTYKRYVRNEMPRQGQGNRGTMNYKEGRPSILMVVFAQLIVAAIVVLLGWLLWKS